MTTLLKVTKIPRFGLLQKIKQELLLDSFWIFLVNFYLYFFFILVYCIPSYVKLFSVNSVQ